MKSENQNSDLQSQINLGKNLARAKQYEKAEDIFLKILKKHKLADVYNAIGLIYADTGQFNFAEVAFTHALKINPSYMEAALNLAVLYNNLGLPKRAKTLYEKLQKYSKSGRGAVDPLLLSKISNSFAEIGDLYHGVGEYKEAIAAYEKAVDLCPHYIDIQTKLAVAYRESGQLKKALAIFTKIKSKAKSYAPFWIALGVTHYARSKRADAKKAWGHALKLDPRNKVALAYARL